jgi:hydrogenase expression/formation protein HypC
VGFAISRVDEAEALRTFELLREMDQLTELDAPALGDLTTAGPAGAPPCP